MQINKIYDLLIIGGGISSSVFVTSFLQDNSGARIAIVEAGRRLGGRSSTRVSNKYKDWELNHGSPNLNISNNANNKELKFFIKDLLNNKIIKIADYLGSSVFVIKSQNLKPAQNAEVVSKNKTYACDCCKDTKIKREKCILIRSTFSESNNISIASRKLGVSRNTIYKHIKK